MSVNGIPQVFILRHGETEWSLNGKHTGVTDIPLTENGRKVARLLQPVLAKVSFRLVLTSPLQRARETCALAGLGDNATIDSDLMEWNYGEYEGMTPQQIYERAPTWMIFEDGCPCGEKPEDVGTRVDRVITKVRETKGNVALFAHGHVLRTLAARWIGMPPDGGMHFLLETGTICILGFYRDARAVSVWNAPLT